MPANVAMIFLCDVLNQAKKAQSPLTDADILTTCPSCQKRQSMADCAIKQTAETTYSCSSCGSPLVILSAPETTAWPGRGFRINDFVIRNACDLHIGSALIPTSPNALAVRDKPG